MDSALPLNYKQQEHVNLRSALPLAISMWGTLELENCFESPTVKCLPSAKFHL